MYSKSLARSAVPLLLAVSLANCGGEIKQDAEGGQGGGGQDGGGQDGGGQDGGGQGGGKPEQCGQRFVEVPDFLGAWSGPRVPLMNVETYSNPIVDPHKIRSMITVEEYGIRGQITHSASHEAGIEIRGSFSVNFPKKSYGIELREYYLDGGRHDDENEVDPDGYHSRDVKASLLGMPEEEDWVLYGPYVDKTLMRNMLMYDLSNDIGRYAPRGRFVDLKINGEHQGAYSLFEKIKRDKNRVDIAKLKDDENEGKDLTGGYIIKIDKIKPEPGLSPNDLSFPSQYSNENGKFHRFSYDYPKPEDITEPQKAYIKNYIDDFENTLNSSTYKDEEIGYRAFIDVDSFVDYFLLSELSHNVDGYRISTFLVKDKNEKLAMGPIWDYNFALGNAREEFCTGGAWNNWIYNFNTYCPHDDYPVPFWWERLLSDRYFVDKLEKRWKELRGSALSDDSILDKIDDYTGLLQKSGSTAQNFSTWDTLDCFLWPNLFVGETFQSEVNFLKEWIIKRANWMDENIDQFNAT